MRAAIYFFLSSLFLLTSGHAAEPTRAPTRAGTTNTVRGTPFLWKVEGPRPSWLFGTIHSSDPLVATLPASVTSALAASKTFHPEIELSADLLPILTAKLFLNDTPELSSKLPAPLWARVKRAGAAMGMPEMVLERLTPGIATLLFSAPAETSVEATVDGQLHTRATRSGLTVQALETLEEQFAIFEKLPESQAVTALKEALDEMEAGRPNEKKLLEAYASGDERRLVAVTEAEFASSPATRALAEPLLYKRNRVMAERLKPYLDSGGAFVAIGAGHLTGPKSVIEQLRAKGLKITRVQ